MSSSQATHLDASHNLLRRSAAGAFEHLSPGWQHASNRTDNRDFFSNGPKLAANQHPLLHGSNIRADSPVKDPYTLLEAARTGDLDLIRNALNQGIAVDVKAGGEDLQIGGDTALHQAASTGQIEVIQVLLGQGASIEATDDLDRTPVMRAILANNYSAAQFLLEHDASPSHRAQGVVTPLLIAIQQDNMSYVDLLIKYGACLETVSGNERGNVLHWAAAGGNVQAISHLLSHGMDIESRDGRYRTPLMVASDSGHYAAVQLLLARGADIEAKSAKGSSALAWASSQGHVDIISLLLDKGADIDSLDEFGHGVLFLSANFGRTEAVKLLLERGAKTEIHSAPPEGLTALHAAISEGHSEVVKLLLLHGCDKDAKTFRGQTALDIAIEDRHQEVLEVILRSFGGDSHPIDSVAFQIVLAADPTALKAIVTVAATCYRSLKSNPNGAEFDWADWILQAGGELLRAATLRKLLQHALEIENSNLLRWLLTQGVDLNSPIEGGLLPLHHALRKSNAQLIKLLLEARADVNTTSAEQLSPLDEAIGLLQKDPANTEPFQLLLNSGALTLQSHWLDSNAISDPGSDETFKRIVRLVQDPDMLEDTHGRKLLHIAISKDLREEAELLLRNGASIDAQDNTGRTPLLYGCYSEPIMRLLLDNGARPKSISNDGVTAMHEAAENDCVGGLILLADLGLDINILDKAGRTPLLRSIDAGAERAAMHLMTAGVNVTIKATRSRTALHHACRNFDEPGLLIPELLERGADIEAQDDDGETPMFEACAFNAISIIRYLLDRGANYNVEAKDGNRPLHIALGFGHEDLAMLLVAAGASITATGKEKRTALHLAALNNLSHVASILIGRGVNPEAVDDTGATALHVASSCGSAAILKLLIDVPTNIDAIDIDGWTPLHHASENGHLREVRMLLAAGADPDIRSLDDGLTARERAEDLGFLDVVQLIDDWVATPANYIPTNGAASGLYEHEHPIVVSTPRTAWPMGL